MRERSDDELRAICTTDAADYTTEALAAARVELARRGHAVEALVPETTSRVDRVAEQKRLGGSMIVAAIVIAMFTAPFIGDAPAWVETIVTSGILALAFVGIRAMLQTK